MNAWLIKAGSACPVQFLTSQSCPGKLGQCFPQRGKMQCNNESKWGISKDAKPPLNPALQRWDKSRYGLDKVLCRKRAWRPRQLLPAGCYTLTPHGELHPPVNQSNVSSVTKRHELRGVTLRIKSLFFLQWKMKIMSKVPEVISVPSHPSASSPESEILRSSKRSCPTHDNQRCGSCMVTVSMRGIAQLGPLLLGSEIWPLKQSTQSERELPPHPTPLPPKAYKELQVFSGLWYLL